jgi:hypothetical protein
MGRLTDRFQQIRALLPGTALAQEDLGTPPARPRARVVVEPIMKRVEYVLSLFAAMLVLAGAAAWTQVAQHGGETALSCRPGKSAAPVVLKGMSVYPRCGAKRG